ncbi:MAG: ketol-acid reductoisomerase [Elusimicrobiota bacterium]|nr:ketol-acid reductoisomerase [Elusimicrobiota bacterium]
MAVKIFYDKDADVNLLNKNKIAIIGYGSQGHAHALNLKESGFNVVVGLRNGGASWERAIEDGWKPMSVKEAVDGAAWVQILTPDETQGELYEKEIKSSLKSGMTLGFAHGFNIRFGIINPPKDVNVAMIAPKGPGHLVRRQYTEGKGVPCLVAINQDATGNALNIALAYAKGIGGTRGGVIQTTFAEETETDLFGEQAVLCGGAVELIKSGFQTLLEAGYQPEIAYFECLHELKLITDLIFEGGIGNMNYSISDTAEYGEYVSGKRVINEASKKAMKEILQDIQDGTFAKAWIEENKKGRPNFIKAREDLKKEKIEIVGEELRKMMPWLKKQK